MTNYDESTQRPSRRAIALDAVLLGVAVGVLIWLVTSLPVRPQWYDWLGVTAWATLSGLELISLVKVVRRRWAAPRIRHIELIECGSCDGAGVGGPASDENTNGMCWECWGEGRIPAFHP